jgi:CRISPR-associated endonuclease Csn1
MRGKKVYVVNAKGEEVEKWQNGDIIRGQLHQESWLGAVRKAELLPNGKTLKRDENGNVVQLDDVIYVKRKELKFKKNDMDSGFKSWAELRKEAVNKSLIDKLEKQYEGLSFQEACEQGIYMLDKHGNKVNRIRHIRCEVSIKNPLIIKKQTYISDSTPSYKQNYYAGMGSLYCMCQYYNAESGKKHYEVVSLFDIAENRKDGKDDLLQEIEVKGKVYTLKRVIHKGVMAIVCHGFDKNDLHSMASDEISKYLYVVKDFESVGLLIKMVKHNNALPDGKLISCAIIVLPYKIFLVSLS